MASWPPVASESAHAPAGPGLDSAGTLPIRTQSARSRFQMLTPAGHKTHTKHLTEIANAHEGTAMGDIAKHLAELKHFNADVTNFIEEVQAELRQEEQLLTNHIRSQSASRGSPLSAPLFNQREHGVSVRSTRPPDASPASSSRPWD